MVTDIIMRHSKKEAMKECCYILTMQKGNKQMFLAGIKKILSFDSDLLHMMTRQQARAILFQGVAVPHYHSHYLYHHDHDRDHH